MTAKNTAHEQRHKGLDTMTASPTGPWVDSRRAWLLLAILGLSCMLVLGIGTPVTGLARFEQQLAAIGPAGDDDDDNDGRAPHQEELVPSVEAAFQSESYAPGAIASLKLFNDAGTIRLQIFHAGPERTRTVGRNEMRGVAVSGHYRLGRASPGRVVHVRIGNWASGMYFGRLDAADGRIGFAPFVVRPRRLGEHRVAVVLPTQTWQAYNIRDDDGDGCGGHSWYADWGYNAASLYRPFLNRGVPPNFRMYDLRFLQWLAGHRKGVDFLSDGDLDSIASADELAHAYELIVFPGHHEYVTTNEYDAIEGYRDRGGNLIFLSANNFFWRIVKHGPVMERTKLWRDLGRPEAALIGVQYRANMPKFGRYVVLDAKSEPWLLAGTRLKKDSVFGYGGIEIDAISSSSPRNVKVVARIPNVFGPSRNADMTIYRTKSGGMVFAAGAFTLADASAYPYASRIIANLWARMTSER